MRKKHKHYGFSLTEVLLAVGTLSIGMIFVAGVFPVAIHFSTIASERTIAAVVTDEAFVKIRLFAVGDPANPADDIDIDNLLRFDELTNFEDAFPPGVINPDEFAYPSYFDADILRSRYCWSALCRRVGMDPASRLVQVTVFISRKINPSATYWYRGNVADDLVAYNYPVPVLVNVSPGSDPDKLVINEVDPDPSIHEETFINDDYTIVDDQTGRLYRVLERDRPPNDNTIVLDRDWQGGSPTWVWVIPPPVNGGRYPCIAVYQKVIGF